MAKAAVGGALRGLGAALVKRTDNEREDRLRAEDRAHQDELLNREHAFTRASQIRNEIFGREEADKDRAHQTREHRIERKHENAQVLDIVPTEGGNDRVVTKGGESRSTDFRSRGLGGSTSNKDGGMSPEDQRYWDSVLETYTTTPPRNKLRPEEDPVPIVDWTAAAAAFSKEGRRDLAARAAERAARDPETIDLGSSDRDPPNADLRGRGKRTAAPTSGTSLPEGIPEGSRLVGKTRAGEDIYETPSGERLIAE